MRSAILQVILVFTAVCMGQAATRAADFQIDVSATDKSRDIYAAVREARRHRLMAPNDTIVIQLPSQLSVSETILLKAQDSGRQGAPLILRGAAVTGTTIDGSVLLPAEAITGQRDIAGIPIPLSVTSRVRKTDLSSVWSKITPAILPKNALKDLKTARLHVYDGNTRLQLSQWPSQGYATAPAITDSFHAGSVTLELPSDAPDPTAEPDLWVAGYWSWNWWYQMDPVSHSGPHTIQFAKPENRIGTDVRYYLANTAQGLDRPGVYYLDRTGKRVFYVPKARGGRVPALSVAVADSILRIEGATHISVEGIGFQKSIGPAVVIEDSRDVLLSDCYAGRSGGDGILVINGARATIRNCVIDDIGQSGVVLIGGNRKTLTASGHAVTGSKISRFGREMPTYRTGVRIFGVGQTVSSSEISDGPHAGIQFFGNDHSITNNDLHDLVKNADDAGAIYAGRNWTSRGTVISGNYIADTFNRIGTSQVRGVYLDDQLSGIFVLNNIFKTVEEPVLIGGGRDNLVSGNLFLDATRSVFMDTRGTTWQADMVKPNGVFWKSLQEVPYQSLLFQRRYPGLATILTDRPGSPINNRVNDNIAGALPLTDYDPPNIARLGQERGNLKIPAKGSLPDILNSLPAATPALAKLRLHATQLQQARDQRTRLRFLYKLSED